MPAETTVKRVRRDGHLRELEQKRSRGEVSCAECRRLKIKCDKRIPCQSCQRRGCASLCPNGSLSTGQGTRFVLAATEHLHQRIAKLTSRVRQLEDGLSKLQAKHSSDPHPLLSEDLVADDRDDDPTPMLEDTSPQAQTEVIDAFGTLSISDHGISRFFGPTGGSESLLLAQINASNTSLGPPTNDSPTTLPELALFSQSFPFTPMGPTADVQDLIQSHLPPWNRAEALTDTYFEQVSWIFRGVTKIQLNDDMLPAIYDKRKPTLGEEYNSPHDLALIFMIFAIGALVQAEPSNAEGEHFHQLARAALGLQPVLEKPSIVTIQTLHLMSIYNAMSGSDLKSETSMEITWSLITLASHLSQTIGLHRDSARWGLSPKMVQRRRILFWDLFVADVWQSLNTGRPPSFSLAYVDCSYPQYDDNVKTGFGSAFEVWQFRFASECVAEVTSRTLTAEAPSYATIMELDHKVREFPLPEGLSNPPKNDLGASFQRCVLDHIRETVLMYIHRSFFAQAIIDQPLNPLKSAYAPSFTAAYRSASTILKSVNEQFNLFPNSCSRFWTMWTFAFTAAVIFGTVVTRGPRSPLAQSAMAELEQALVLFKKASKYSIRALKALPILTTLAEKARFTLANVKACSAGNDWTIQLQTPSGGEEHDELSIFAGHTRFVSATKTEQCETKSKNTSAETMLPPPPPPPTQHQQHQQQQQPLIYGWQHAQQQPTHYDYSYVSVEQTIHHQLDMPSTEPSSSQRDRYTHPGWSADPITLHPPTVPQLSTPSHTHTHYGHQGSEDRMDASSRTIELHPPYYPTSATHSHTPSPPHLVTSHQRPPPPSVYAPSSHHPPPPPTAAAAVAAYTLSSYSQYPTSLSHHSHVHHPQQQAPQISHHPQYPHHPHDVGTAELADLGLASRDSRLDERWSSFMADSGLLEGINFQAQ